MLRQLGEVAGLLVLVLNPINVSVRALLKGLAFVLPERDAMLAAN
jgi:hypothetical protein